MKTLALGFYHTPPLWTNEQFGLTQFDFPEVDSTSFPQFNLPENLRLGHQMEYIFRGLMHVSKEYEVVISNLLVDEGKTRIGELDFILKNRQVGKFIHVELAYKFYIIKPDISEPIYRLMGPNRRDMFYTKLDKLKEKQFPLLHHPSLQDHWDTLDCDPLVMEQQCCFKAQLFHEYGNRKVNTRPLNTACLSGSWVRFDDFNTKEFRSNQYYIPRKLEWAVSPHENVKWMTHYDTSLDVNLGMVKEKAPMLWVKQPSGEIEKLFVVWW